MVLLVSTASATIELEAWYWHMLPEGHIAVGNGGIEGSRLDLRDDLGYDREQGVWGFQGIWGDIHQLGASYFWLDMDSSAKLDRTVNYAGQVFPAFSEVSSSWRTHAFKAFYRLNLGSSYARGGVIVGAQYLDVSSELDSSDIHAEETIRTWMPYFGAYFLGFPYPWLGFRGTVEGAKWKIDNVDTAYLDIRLGVEFNLFHGGYLSAAYRYLDINAEYRDDPIDTDVTLAGPVVIIGYEW
jgi:hypothetical protein